MNWKVGDVAICVKVGSLNGDEGKFPPLRLNSEYIIQNINECECGHLIFDVGLANTTDNGVLCNCGAMASKKSGIWWCNSIRFVKKELKKDKLTLQEELKVAIAAQDYERATEIRDTIKKLETA